MARARVSGPEPYAASLVGSNLRSRFTNNHRFFTKQLPHRHSTLYERGVNDSINFEVKKLDYYNSIQHVEKLKRKNCAQNSFKDPFLI